MLTRVCATGSCIFVSRKWTTILYAETISDTLPEWSKGVDSSSTSASSVGSNPTGVILGSRPFAPPAPSRRGGPLLGATASKAPLQCPGATRHATASHDTTRHDTARHHTAPHGMARQGTGAHCKYLARHFEPASKSQLWGSSPRPCGLAPEANSLDHSAKPSCSVRGGTRAPLGHCSAAVR